MGVIVSRLREDFLCQARVSAAKMGEKEGAKLKWTLLSVVICSNFPRNSERKTGSPNSERARLPRNVMD